MFNFWHNATMLSFEAQRVINLRMLMFAKGGSEAQAEAKLMVEEKLAASLGAAATLFGGGSGNNVLDEVRKRVRANYRRLSRK